VKTLNQLVFFKIKFRSATAIKDQFWGDRSLCSGTLLGRGSALGAISIDSIASAAVSIDFTAISIDVVVSYDEEGVVLPRG
jgi:hypothetical protein